MEEFIAEFWKSLAGGAEKAGENMKGGSNSIKITPDNISKLM